MISRQYALTLTSTCDPAPPRPEIPDANCTALAFIFSLWANQEIFTHSEFGRGVNWIYLRAGIRLLATLLLGGDGALDLLLASWLVDFFYFFSNDALRSFVGGIIATVAPYAVYRFAQKIYGLRASLTNLTAKRLSCWCWPTRW